MTRVGSSSTSIAAATRLAAATAAATSSPASIGRIARAAAADARSMGSNIGFYSADLDPRPRCSRLRAEAAVPVEDRVAPEERDDAAEREERPEWNRLLPRLSAVPHQEQQRGNERSEEPHEHRHDHGDAEAGSEEGRELDVAHPEP